MLEKDYRPAEVEAKHYAAWEKDGAFAAHPDCDKTPYTIMMPPPNVTGSLHMGHALTFTVQDILIRYFRMRGRDALWQPGTDHAGIATQMVVERELAKDKLSRHDLGRERFLERVWDWKHQSGDTITRQLRRLGASADWPRERFTMDDGLSHAVRKVFVALYREGLIYRDKRLVNWDPKLHTAISDLEVQQRDVEGKLWYVRYAIEDMPGRSIVVATTRPETMLGDSGVAVHPDDPRYKDLIGKNAILPLVGRRLPIVADDYADPETGTGAVKMTPAHDFNDFEVGRRHGLDLINIFDQNAVMNDNVPEGYRGMERFDAREKVLAELVAEGLLVKEEPHRHVVPHGDRSGVVIEPWLTDQWYLDAETLAKPAIAAVEDGRIEFVPRQWENTYFEWMRNIQPWCISRQLWWGHQIPAWYGPDGEIFVAEEEAEALRQAREHYGKETALVRDEDVLDTWFSSALWPFSTLGWPEQTAELKRYYPGDVLVTGFDIIFFWVARMIMMGLHFMGDVPFRTVYIHALVRDQHGQKMSKSKGNIIDPLDLIEKYGCDSLRFTLAALSAQGRDVKLAESRVAGYRNFITKLRMATRFAQMNGLVRDPTFDPAASKLAINRWIVGKLVATARDIEQAIEAYRFNDAANALYRFTWNSFCDWYIEFAKPIFDSGTPQEAAEVRACLAWVLERLLHLMHPLCPFVTEELMEAIGAQQGSTLITAPWPDLPDSLHDAEAEAEIDWVIALISDIRAARAELNVPASAKAPLILTNADEKTLLRLRAHKPLIERLARLESSAVAEQAPQEGAVQIAVEGATAVLPLSGLIDLSQERQRLKREGDKAAQEVVKLEKKLSNKQFLEKAPAEVIETQRERLQEAQDLRDRLGHAVQRLGG